jgi:hypothetical protein
MRTTSMPTAYRERLPWMTPSSAHDLPIRKSDDPARRRARDEIEVINQSQAEIALKAPTYVRGVDRP